MNPGSGRIAALREFFSSRLDVFYRGLIKNIGWATAGQAVTALGLLAETFLLAHYLTMAEFGTLLILIALVELIFGLLDCRGGEAVIKFFPELEREGGRTRVGGLLRFIFGVDALLALSGCLLIPALAPLWGALYPDQKTFAPLLVVLALGAGLKALVRSTGSFLRVSGAFPLSVKCGMAALVFRLTVLGLALGIRPELQAMVWAIMAADAFFCVILAAACRRKLNQARIPLGREANRLDPVRKREVAGFLFYINLASTMRILATKMDVLLIAALSSTGVVALYKVAARMAGMVLLFSDPLVLAVYPELSKLYAEGALGRAKTLIIRLSLLLGILAGLIFIVFILAGRLVLDLIAGSAYDTAFPTVLLMLAGTMTGMVFFWLRPVLMIRGQNKKIAAALLISIVIQFLGIVFLVPIWAEKGAGLALALHFVIANLLFALILKTHQAKSNPASVARSRG